MRMEPTVRMGKKTKFYNYFGMGKAFAHEAIIGLYLHSRGPNAFAHMAAVLKYFYQSDDVLIVVRNRVNPEAKTDFSVCMRNFSAACATAELFLPVAYSPEFTAKWGLELRNLRESDDEDGRGLMHSWVELGVHAIRQAFCHLGPLGSVV